jgi:8-oxo-dGTP pyrophosphatase MutT (NUDIX family)
MSAVPVRDAASVVLLRDGPGGTGGVGIQAWLLTRVTQMAFAAGMSVFPGGRVDDTDGGLPFSGAACTEVAARFGCTEALACALLGAAVRETFEETGVLLSVPAKVTARASPRAAPGMFERGFMSPPRSGFALGQGVDSDVAGQARRASWRGHETGSGPASSGVALFAWGSS